jgi:hypothetical protein
MTHLTLTKSCKAGLLLGLAVVISLAVAAKQQGASAAATHSSCVTQHHPTDPSWATVCERQYIAVCDGDRDGHKTYVDYFPTWSTQVLPSMTQYDSYGTTGGQFCWHERPSDAQGLGLNRFRVCVQYEKCSAYRYP